MDTAKKKVSAFMTAPRYENTYARNFIELAFRKCGIPLAVSGGVFYGQCMQRMMEQALDVGCEIGITVDFDSMFTEHHVRRLLAVLCSNDHIDAVAAFQCRRGAGTPLATIKGQNSVEWDGVTPLEATTAHFGLTAIDMTKLASTPKPWFYAQPDANGEWGDDKIDDDIWFWKQWREAGNSIYLDPANRIGHMEEVVTVFNDQMQPVQMYPADWRTANGC